VQTIFGMRVVELSSGRLSKAAPGFRVLAVDGGAIRFECPIDWILAPPVKYVCLIDRHPPEDRCALTVAWRQIPAGGPVLCLAGLLDAIVATESRALTHRGKVIRLFRPPLEVVWIQLRFVDPRRNREAYTRICLARACRAQALAVFDFWPEDEMKVYPVWETFLSSLALGEYIDDPATGLKREQWG
jgi:hypothetical protein